MSESKLDFIPTNAIIPGTNMSADEVRREDSYEGLVSIPEGILEPIPEDTIPELSESKHSASDVAATFFSMNERKLKNLLSKLSTRQLKRVIMSVASYPLKGEYAPVKAEEKSAAYIFSEMNFNKAIMMLEMEMQRVETAQKQELEKLSQEGDINV